MSLDARARARLAALEAAGLRRRCPTISERRGVTYRLDGTPVVGFCSNDYLGLADAHALAPTRESAAGAGASRLICGDLPEHREAERALAELVGAEDAVLFPSGFQLNVGVLPCLLETDDVVASDRLNHASLIDGLRLARTRPQILAHATTPPPPPSRTDDEPLHWWVTETIFSMDGDRIDPRDAAAHLDAGGAIYADEAHALGLFDRGQGWLGHHGVSASVVIGTASKSLGAAGAFVAASATVCDLVRNRARSFVFSTGVAPTVAARIRDAVARVRGSEGDARRERLWSLAHRLATRLDLPEPPSPIFPFVVGDNARALAMATALRDRGLHVQAIRPPTVPVGTARLRVTLSAAHEPAHVDRLAEGLRAVFDAADLPLAVHRGITEARDGGS